MKNCYWIIFLAIIFSCSDSGNATKQTDTDSDDAEIIYHVVQRSFYDSNGDLHGDFNGLRGQLDYLQELGITSILLLPINESPYYHNYFASDFEKTDPKFGTMDDFINLVKEVHRRGMKIYIDMETQYVTEDHLWYKDSYGNPQSRYSDYITYDDSTQKEPSTIVYNLKGLKGYDGTYKRITTVNMNSPKVKDYNLKLFSYWMDPDNDGKFDDGVDGFRLDHMMDDLDDKGRWTHLFRDFWKPMIEKLKTINPKVIFMAEQADWGSFGFDYFAEAGVDRVFAFRIAFEIRNLNKDKLITMADSVFSLTPRNKNQIVFIENHDMPRYASVVNGDPGKLRVGAALNLLLGEIPSVYYGQEIGMKGAGKTNEFVNSDANEIPEREAFEWYRSDTGKGMAFWYKDSGPWWNRSQIKPDDGISLEEEKDDPESLLNFYKKIIRLRRENGDVFRGIYKNTENDAQNIFSFMRETAGEAVLVIVNLSGEGARTIFNIPENYVINSAKQLLGDAEIKKSGNNYQIYSIPYAINVFSLHKK